MKKVSIVVPAYNEADNVQELYLRLSAVFEKLGTHTCELIFVDDGSSDHTFETIRTKCHKTKFLECVGIKLTRNFGHQNALRAGIEYATGDAVVTMDSDLQHPPELIGEFISKWESGVKIVHTIRNYHLVNLKQLTSLFFYKIINFLSPTFMYPGIADFRLLDRDVVENLKRFKEYDLFLRGIVQTLGYRQEYIKYEAAERFKGETKFTPLKMMKLALTGVTSLSTIPLYFAIVTGFTVILLGMIYLVYILYAKFFLSSVIPGWSSVMSVVLLIGGVQMLILGIIGIYISRIFWEIKSRPAYLIEQVIKC